VPSALLADESRDDEVLPFINKNEELETQDETSLAGDIGAAAGFTTGASIASKATKADPLKGVRRFGKQGAKNLLKGIFKVAGSPSAAAGFAGSEILDYKKPEDASVLDRFDPRNYEVQEDPNIKLAGASLLAPELVGSLAPAGKSILSRAGSILMNPFGKAARAFTPVGLATIAGGAGYDVYKEIKRRQELTDEERLQEDIEAQARDDEMMVGAAEGGRIGYSNGSDGTDLAIKEILETFGPDDEGIKISPNINITKTGSTPYEGIDQSITDRNYGVSGLLQFDNKYIGGNISKGNVKVEVQKDGNTVFNDTLSKEKATQIYAGLGERYGNNVEVATDMEGNFTFRIISSFNAGGRVGFADGNDPKDPGRRTFMKLAAGLASIPILGKFFKPAVPLVKKLANSNTVMPDWFPNFVDKFVGRSIGKKIDADLIEYTNPDLPNVKLTRKDDGSILVEGKNEFNEAYNISYEPPGYELIDETTGKAVKTKGEFEAVEGRHVALGPEDYDTDAFYADDLDELYTSDIADMEKYTTGNVTDTAKDAFGRDTGLKKGMYDSDMAQGRAENQADILADEGLDEID